MSNCFVDMAHPMHGYNAQDKNNVITVSVTEEIRPCVRWSTQHYISTSNSNNPMPLYVRKDVPEDQINCNPLKCLNTGTLYLVPDRQGKSVGVKYQVRANADDFALGFNFIYLKLPKAGKYELKVIVSDYYDRRDQTNAYIYTYGFSMGAPGYSLRTIDFADSRVMTQNGKGWTPSDQGITITYQVQYKGEDELTGQIGLSTGMIVDDRAELRKFSNVLLSCLTSFTHNVSVPATDARCFGSQYNKDDIEITKDITATTTSCNDYWLNPLQSMSRKLTSGVPVTDEFNVVEKTVDGKRYGSLVLPDLYYGECNTITISSDRCECTYLSNLPTSTGVDLEDDEFILLSQEHMGADRGTVLVNPMYIGEKLLVTYNAERNVELIVANDKRLNKTHTRVIQEVLDTRGRKEYYVFNNVLITENSREFGTDSEVTLSLSLTVSRDDNGNFYEIRRNLEDIV